MSTAPRAKFGAMSTPTPDGRRPASRSGLDPLVGPAGGADDHVHARCDAVGDVAGRRVGHRELDRDVGATEVAEVVTDVEAADQLEVVGVVDGARTPSSPSGHPRR